MASDSELGQRKVVDLDRGLFLVQYNSAEDRDFPPKVVISPAPGHEQRIEIITHPDSDGATLWQPQTSLVVLASEPASLQVMVVPMKVQGSRAASVRIEPIAQGKAADEVSFESRDPFLDQLRILAHVAGIGDVVVAANEWIAGPNAPSRIEGLSVQFPQQSAGADIRYSVKFGNGQVSATVGAGEFAGTRRRALPITGLIFEISGTSTQNCQLAADAIFLSSPAIRVTGKRIVLSGPTGREPLVGLRLAIERTNEVPVQQLAATPDLASQAIRAPQATKAPSSGRVRVFRSRAKQNVE